MKRLPKVEKALGQRWKSEPKGSDSLAFQYGTIVDIVSDGWNYLSSTVMANEQKTQESRSKANVDKSKGQ